jgi:hypothetical protein
MDYSYDDLLTNYRQTEEELLKELSICREIIQMIETYKKMYPKGIEQQ